MKTQNQKIGQKGVAAVEFALVLPLLLVLAFGIIEFSILFYNKAMVTNASREGARVGIVFADPRADDGAIESVVTAYCGNHLITFGDTGTSPSVTISRSGPGGGTEAGDSLTVRVNYQYDFLVLPNLPGITLLEEGINLEAITVMRME